MGLKLVPEKTNIQFTKGRMVAFAISVLALIGSVFAFTIVGLNFGIDFKGGVTVEIAPDGDKEIFTEDDLGKVRNAVDALGLGETKVSFIKSLDPSSPEGISVILEQQQVAPDTDGDAEGSDTETSSAAVKEAENAQQLALKQVLSVLNTTLGEGNYDLRREDVVGPTVSGELIESGVKAVVIAVLMMLAYIWFRFEWQFSLGAVLALIHDVILTIGMFAITQLDFSLSIIAALLTIIGYSMNDTVVVYDRVRENLRKFKKKELTEVLDLSINETLSRTVMTSVTTLIALISLFVLGGDVLRGFTAAMIWGVLIGTYSSIFIASPILLVTGVSRDTKTAQVPATP